MKVEKKKERIGSIYTLSDESGVRYVGQSYNVKRRYNAHCSLLQNTSSSYKDKWLSKLLCEGKKPILNVILETSNLDKEEIRLIAEYREKGFNLVNTTIGGNDNTHITKRKLNTPWKGKHTPLQKILLNYRQTINMFIKLNNQELVKKVQAYIEYTNSLIDLLGKDEINRRLYKKYGYKYR